MRASQRERDHARFTTGDCHILARELHRRTGWPMCAFVCEGYEHAATLHVFVRMPDGRYLDVEGPQTEDELIGEWIQNGYFDAIHEFDAEAIASQWGGPHLTSHSYVRARAVAGGLLTDQIGVG